MAGARAWKTALLTLHRWVALSAGILLMLNAATGLLMLVARPLDDIVNPHLFKVQPQSARVSLESIRQALQAEAGRQTVIMRPPVKADDALVADVRGDDGWEGHVYTDPYTGRRLGARGRFEPGIEGLFELHSTLLAGATGKNVIAIAAACFFFMLVSGAVLWWPRRWKLAFKVALGGGRLRALFDLHRVGGATLGLWAALAVGSGGLMAWRPASDVVNGWLGQAQAKAPVPVPASAGTPKATLDHIVEQANAALPGGFIGSIQLPTRAAQPIRLRKRLEDDPHPFGLSTVWLHPHTGQVLRVDRWDQLAWGNRMYAWVYPLHSGRLGGSVGVVITAVGGAALLGFGITGTWLWWARRSRRASSHNAAATTQRSF